MPIITAKVINKTTRTAGEGFYDLYTKFYPEDKNLSNKAMFEKECKRITDFKKWDILIQSEKQIKGFKDKKQIRILPMSRIKEFQEYDIEDIQKFFFNGDLTMERDGRFFLEKKG